MDFPSHREGITAEWLTDILQETGVLDGASVRSCATQMLGSEKGMTGHLVHVRVDYDSVDASGPRSVIAKFSAPHPQARRALHSMGFYEREARFYNEIAPRATLRTPRCYFSAIDPAEGFSLLLLEDLSAARNASAITGCSIAEAELAVLDIAPFHARWWQDPFLEAQGWLRLRGFFSPQQIQASFDQTWEAFLNTISEPLADQIAPFSDDLHRHLGHISTHLYLEGPRTLIHNDYHADNLFFVETGDARSLVVADWQVTTMGRGVIDVARFLGGNLDPQERHDHELRLLRAYYARLLDNGVKDYPFEQCWADYRLAMLLPLGLITTVIGMTSRMMANPGEMKGGPREVIASRYCEAVVDLKVSELLKVVSV